MAVKSNKVLEKLKGEVTRERFNLYLNAELYREFREYCGDISASRVIEELMKNFIEELKNEKTKGK